MPGAAEHSNPPPLTAAQAAHLQSMRAHLRSIASAQGGWLRFDEYLQQVLYAPGLGYYSAGATKFGAGGDFTTAPELSALFGHCIARQVAPLLRSLGEPADILELGAGTGRLAATVLERLATLAVLPRRYFILEVSADLRQRQRERLARLPTSLSSRIEWLEALPAEPLRGVMLANEVADALPFQRFAVSAEGVDAMGVRVTDDALMEEPRAADAALLQEVRRIEVDLPGPLPMGYRSEICPLLDAWIQGLAGSLAAGALLLFDYGVGRREYYHPQRTTGTLRCHFRHRAHEDALALPGLQDVTAWVDFTRVAEAAVAAGLEVAGYCNQAAFLLGAGIDAELAAADDTITRARLASEARQLLLPGEMGEVFKAMALTKHCPLPSFGAQDLRRTL